MSGSVFMLLLRLGFSLALVLGMVWGAGRMLRTRGGGLLRGTGSRLEILERKPLGKASSVALVRVDGQTLMLGVSEHGVNVLADVMEPEGSDPAEEFAAGVPVDMPVDVAALAPGAIAPESTPAPTPTTTTTAGVRSERVSFVEALRELTVRRPPTTRSR